MSYKYKYNRTLLPFSYKNRRKQTDAEKLLWLHLRNRRLKGYKFRRQYPVYNYILDFYCVEKGLAVELDGSQHIEKMLYDKKRSLDLQKLNIRIIRFWDTDVLQNTDGILEEILRELESSSGNKPHPDPLLRGEGGKRKLLRGEGADTKALQLEARFSLPPNFLGYCGRDSAAGKFNECIVNGKCKEVGEELRHFIVLYPYLETIAGITKLPVFSYEVIESYWLGNDLLKKAKPEHYDLLLKNFEKQGVPNFFVNELKQKPPKVFIPNHLFQVLHVGVGRASGAVPFNLESINNCMIRWGEVTRLIGGKAVIDLHSLELLEKSIKPVIASDRRERGNPVVIKDCFVVPPRNDNKAYALVVKKETVPIDTDFVPGIKLGNIVAVHWNMVIKILNKQEEKKLKYWTKKCLVLFSLQARKRLLR